MPTYIDDDAVTPLNEQQRQALSANAASEYEARRFMELTPEYYRCPKNQEILLTYMANQKMTMTIDNFLSAFAKLRKAGKLIVMPTPAEVAEMSLQDTKKLLKKYPDALEHIEKVRRSNAEPEAAPTRRQTKYHPEDYQAIDTRLTGYRPSALEKAMWTAEQVRKWMNANPDGQL